MSAAAVIVFPVAARPLRTATRLSPDVEPFLVDPGDEKDLVVHRQTEQDGEEHDRQERLDRPGPVDAEDRAEPPPLEDRHQDAERRPDGQMFMAAETSGITMLRKTTASSRNDSKTTSPMNRGSLADSTWAKSTKIAVVPPTKTVSADPDTAAGMVVLAQLIDRGRSSPRLAARRRDRR